MGARMSTETFWRHLQVKQLYSWIKSLPLRGKMVCVSHTLWSGRPLTRRMRARFPSDDGTLSPDSSRSDSSSLTDRRQGQQGFPRCDSLPFTSMLSPRFTLNLPMNRYASDGRRTRVQLHNLCASAVVVSRILGESACVMVWFRARIQHLTAEWTKVPSEGDREPETKSKETAVRHPAVNPVC